MPLPKFRPSQEDRVATRRLDRSDSVGRLVGALAVALTVGAVGLYAYSASGKASHPAPLAVATLPPVSAVNQSAALTRPNKARPAMPNQATEFAANSEPAAGKTTPTRGEAMPPVQPVTPQAPQSSTPQADNAAPAQDQQTGATPAPAPTPAR